MITDDPDRNELVYTMILYHIVFFFVFIYLISDIIQIRLIKMIDIRIR